MSRLPLIATLCLLILLTLSSAATAHEAQGHSANTQIQQTVERQHTTDVSSLRIPAAMLLLGFGLLGLSAFKVRPLDLARYGGVAGLISGAVAVVFSALPVLPADHSASKLVLDIVPINAFMLLAPIGELLATVALAGLYALLGTRSSVGTKGIVLVYSSATTLAVIAVYGSFFNPRFLYGSLGFTQAVGWVWMIGFMLLGIATFRTGALGRWRIVPLVLFLMVTPIPQALTTGFLNDPSVVLFFLPGVAAGFGWVVLGYLMLRASAKLSTVRETGFASET